MTEKKEKALQTEQVSSNIRFDHNLREKIEQENNRKVLAEKLLYRGCERFIKSNRISKK